MTTAAPVVQLTGVTVAFPGVTALDAVDFRLFPGEVHSLMGENGAGKSTLIKALTGVNPIDAGRIEVDGHTVSFASTAEAQSAGISTVYQELNLLPNLTVTENVLLGREPRHRWGGINWRAARQHTAELLTSMHLDIDPTSLLADHSPAIQQLVAIARAIAVRPKVLVLDEPTSSLDNDEVSELFRIISRLRESGVAILFISHFLEQVYAISDRLTVLRDGRLVGEYLPHELLRIDLVQKMLGKDITVLDGIHERVEASTIEDDLEGEVPLVTAIGLSRRGAIEPIDLKVYQGEIVGIAGLLGSGRTELARLLGGADRPDSGELLVDGDSQRFSGPRAALQQRIAYASENRRTEGIIGDLTVRENIVLALQADLGWLRRIPQSQQNELATSYIQAMGITPADPDALMSTLSGGNQQKVLLARWLAIAPRLLILDEPTRGIDIGAKAEIQKLVTDLAANGLSVVFISAELEEVVRISNRVAILRERRKVGDLLNHDLTVDQLLAVIADGSNDDGLE
ncbi:MAG: sugar ABC transporter ATP-binding protein [Herbiconiux sp.]|uniref:sugar ABC transporter ATP-binding protein n=1 Tax=Herbiconiux sp. TaxID=1871186 RepID=UPI001227C491|nr:sugar ABC transporter ATP-binding protein [Herbiconiux sp.]TAJ48559.1 MAG: sugar ABC transporter ATP-binding protein [Herbiconiux sp.]